VAERKEKMKIEDVIALTQAGFTKSEILGMTQPAQQVQQVQQTQPAQQVQQTQQTQQVQQTQQTQPAQQNEALLNAITNLTNVIQAGNLAATGLQTKHSQPETADQIAKRMMEIMN
jgi:hypothetical protein